MGRDEDETSKPTLSEVLQRAIDVARAGLQVTMPAIVTAYDEVHHRVDVQPAIKNRVANESGIIVAKSRPILTDLPVLFEGSGDYYQGFPIVVGSYGTVHFCGTSISRFKVSGGEVDPGDDRRHHEADAVFLPAGRPTPKEIPELPPRSWVIAVPGGSTVRLGAPEADESAVLGDTYRDAEDTMLSAMSAAWAVLIALPTNAAQILGLGGADAAAIAGFTTAITAFQHAHASYLTSRVKLAAQPGGVFAP